MTMKSPALGLLLACASTAALAQTAPPPAADTPAPQPAAPQTTTTAPATTPPADASPSTGGLQGQIDSDLKTAGYTDVMVQPGSYIAQGKKNGEAVTLLIGPASVTEIVMGEPVKTGTTSSQQMASDMFTAVPSADGLSSQVVGTSVTNKDNASVGTIKDVAFTPQGAVKAYILGVGGFLGLGDHYVAVRPSAVKLTYDAGARKWRATMDADADALKKAPEYRYPS